MKVLYLTNLTHEPRQNVDKTPRVPPSDFFRETRLSYSFGIEDVNVVVI